MADISTANVDAGTDSPRLARNAIYEAIQKLNALTFVSVFSYMLPGEIADVRAGTALVDVTAAVQACIDDHDFVSAPGGRYKLSADLQLRSGCLFVGAGKGVWEPYSGGAFPDVYKTEFVIGTHSAFTFAGTNGAKVQGVSVKSTGGSQSTFGSPADYMSGAIGFDLTDSKSAEIENVSGHGLEFMFAASHAVDGGEASMFRINDFAAVDCDTVIRIGNAGSSDMLRARDFMVSDCVIALHCNHMMEVHGADGVTVNMCRFFQSYGKSLYFRNCAFVQMSAVTTFETANDSLTFEDCFYVSCGAMIISRTGGYVTGAWAVKNAVTVLRTKQFSFQGIVEQPAWQAFRLIDSEAIHISGSVRRPFFTYGNLGAGGAIHLEGCINTVLDCAVNEATCWFAVEADAVSMQTLSGKVAHPAGTGVCRAPLLSDRVWSYTLPASTAIAASGSLAIGTARIKVPAGASLITRSVYQSSSAGIVLRSAALFWLASITTDADGETNCIEQKTVYTNSTGAAVYAEVPFSLHNPTGGSITLPPGHAVHISYAVA